MPQTTPATLPEPPEFPASNASYNKIVGKMHKAALSAATSSAAVAAVTMCKDAVGGINTYAKASRRYADALIAALSENHPVDTPLEAAKKAAAKKAAVAEKPAMPQLAKPAKAKPEKLAKGVAEACAAIGKSFSNKSNAKRALKSLGLDHLPVDFEPGPDGTFRPVVTVEDAKGIAYAAERGIAAKVAA